MKLQQLSQWAAVSAASIAALGAIEDTMRDIIKGNTPADGPDARLALLALQNVLKEIDRNSNPPEAA